MIAGHRRRPPVAVADCRLPRQLPPARRRRPLVTSIAATDAARRSIRHGRVIGHRRSPPAAADRRRRPSSPVAAANRRPPPRSPDAAGLAVAEH
ncbi:hypothetical protein NL676_038944 [Syzygium grande]|nr:hypothetical protein NL676_038944 [Syzygium grande]